VSILLPITLQEALFPFLVDAGAAVEGAGGVDALLSAFMSYWISINWQQVGGGGRSVGKPPMPNRLAEA